jgi:hypothetical protein
MYVELAVVSPQSIALIMTTPGPKSAIEPDDDVMEYLLLTCFYTGVHLLLLALLLLV